MSPEANEPRRPPIRKDKEIEIKEREIEVVKQVISDSDLKTQFKQSERIIISMLEIIATRPFHISEKIATERGLKINYSKYKYPFLSDWIKGYVRKGKALDRKGIKEDTDVVSAYFTAQIERARQAQSVPTHMK